MTTKSYMTLNRDISALYCSDTYENCYEKTKGECPKTHMDSHGCRENRLCAILCHEHSVSNTDKLNELRTYFGTDILMETSKNMVYRLTRVEIEQLLDTRYPCYTRCCGSPVIKLTNAMKINALRGIYFGEQFVVEYILKRKDPNVNDTSRLNSLINIAHMVGRVYETRVGPYCCYHDAKYDADIVELILYRKPFTVKCNDIVVKKLVTDTDRIDYLKQLFGM